jgi:hypothetical protein
LSTEVTSVRFVSVTVRSKVWMPISRDLTR